MTAAGGFVQAVLYGYLGLRYNDENMTLLTPTVALDADGMGVRGMSYRGAVLDVTWRNAEMGTSIICTDQCELADVGFGLLCAKEGRGAGAEVKRLSTGVAAKFSTGVTVVVAPCASLLH